MTHAEEILRAAAVLVNTEGKRTFSRDEIRKYAVPQNSLGSALCRERLPAADQLLKLRLGLLGRAGV